VGLVRSWVDFWFTPADPAGLHALRLLAGALFLGWLLGFVGQHEALFGLGGWFDRQAYQDAARLPGGPPVPFGWSLLYLCGTSPALLSAAFWLSVAAVALFAAGVWPRVTGVLTWVAVASFLANPAARFDADYLLAVLAFYLMVGYLLFGLWGRPQTFLTRLAGPAAVWPLGPWLFGGRPAPAAAGWPSHAANFAVRLLQVHFAIIVMVSGLHKLQFGDWWAGVAFWYPLHPAFTTTPEVIRSYAPGAISYLFWLSLAQYAVLAWQILFPAFAWRRRWRPVLLGGAALGWAGSVVIYGQPLFGPVYLIGCLNYLTPAEWRSLAGRLARVARLSLPARRSPAATGGPVKAGARA
jgi:hypothetical protein